MSETQSTPSDFGGSLVPLWDETPRATTENTLYVSDCDEALPRLNPYRGAVRVALLDPPYNTSSKFHHYEDATDHASWLADRRRHLYQVRELLSEDGSLWLHLDDSEMHYCKVLLDELFGRSNFVATVVWQKTLSRENRTAISTTHEYLLVYAKNRTTWSRSRNLLPLSEAALSRYQNADGDPRGPWISGDMTAKAGPGRRASQFYDVVTPSGRTVTPAPGMAWRFTRDRFEELVDQGRVTFGPNGSNMPRLKRFLAETQQGLVPNTWWSGIDVGTTETSKKQLRQLVPDLVPFETPKPEELAHRVLSIASNPGDLVLDCYAGSGTTLAVAHKMRRRWIGIEREERTVAEFLEPRLLAVKEGRDPGGVTGITRWNGGGDYRIVRSSDMSQSA